MKSMAGNRLRNGVFAAFFLLLAVYLGCYFLLLVTSGPYQPTDRMDAETAMRLASVAVPILRIILAGSGFAMTAVFLFAAMRLSRRVSGILALAYTLFKFGTAILPSLITINAVHSYFVPFLPLSMLSILSASLLYWLLTPWLAGWINEPVSMLLVLLLSRALSLVILFLPDESKALSVGIVGWAFAKEFVVEASVIFLVYALLRWIFRSKKVSSSEGLDNG